MNEEGLRHLREHQTAQQMKKFAENYDLYRKVPVFRSGDFVLRRIRERGGTVRAGADLPASSSATTSSFALKEGDIKTNIGRTVYQIVTVHKSFPLLSYTLRRVSDSTVVPGKASALDLVPAPVQLVRLALRERQEEQEEGEDS